MREETPTLKDTLILPIMRKETLPQAMIYLRHFEQPSVKPQRRKTISEAFQATSSAVPTLHQVVSFSCAVNHRSRYLWSMLTQFGRRRQIWKMCKRASVTTTGTSMATQFSGKIGHVSLDLSACRNPNKCPGQILHGKSSNTKRINEKHTKQKMLHVREETGKTSISSNAEYHISLRHPVQRMRESTHAGNEWTFYTFEQQHDSWKHTVGNF